MTQLQYSSPDLIYLLFDSCCGSFTLNNHVCSKSVHFSPQPFSNFTETVVSPSSVLNSPNAKQLWQQISVIPVTVARWRSVIPNKQAQLQPCAQDLSSHCTFLHSISHVSVSLKKPAVCFSHCSLIYTGTSLNFREVPVSSGQNKPSEDQHTCVRKRSEALLCCSRISGETGWLYSNLGL